MAAALVIGLLSTPGCCKKDTIADVGEEIAEASDIAKMQFKRCRAADDDDACQDVVKKLDAIETLALELGEQARRGKPAATSTTDELTPETVTEPPGARHKE
jgi:hypothetical protein